MLQAMVDSPEEAEGWDAPQAKRASGTGGSMTSSTLHRILQVREAVMFGNCIWALQLPSQQQPYHLLQLVWSDRPNSSFPPLSTPVTSCCPVTF